MINRNNYKMILGFLDYRRRVIQNDEKTVKRGWVSLKHLLQWLDETPLHEADKIRVTFPQYLLTARNDGKEKTLDPSTMNKILAFARDVFIWGRRSEPRLFKSITDVWLDTLRVRKSHSEKSRLTKHEFWTLEEVRKVMAVEANGLRHQRDKAAIAFMFLSAIRGGAFVTLPAAAVSVEKMLVQQLPELGVQTKNSKAAITFLLPIPDLMEVVKTWDSIVRAAGSSGRAWYSKLNSEGSLLASSDEVGTYSLTARRSALYQGVQELCELAGVEFKSPHKLRHGFGVYGIKRAKNMKELKALSQNMMHANVGITDGRYGRLPEEDIQEVLTGFTE